MPLYVDIGISAILLIALIVGAIRGFAKQFSGIFCGLVGLIGSIYLTLIIMPILQKLSVFNSFAAFATGWFKSDMFSATIAGEAELLEALSSGFLKILSKLSPRIWAAMVANEMSTLGAYFGDLCARMIVGIVLWILLLILINLIFVGIKKLLKRLAKLPVLNILDKIFGAAWSVGIAYIVLVCIIITAAEIVIVKWLPKENIINTINNIINNSTIFKFLHNTNVIGSYIARLLGVDLATMAPIA